MWIFTVLPDIFIHILLAIGVISLIAGYLIGFIPAVKPYTTLVQLIGIIILCLSIYLEGGLADTKEWESRTIDLKVKIADMEKQIAQSDIKVIEKVITKTQVVREKGKDVIKYVDREIVKYDTKFLPGGQCELPQEFFKAYNDSLGKDIK
jgi:hypothetical protein